LNGGTVTLGGQPRTTFATVTGLRVQLAAADTADAGILDLAVVKGSSTLGTARLGVVRNRAHYGPGPLVGVWPNGGGSECGPGISVDLANLADGGLALVSGNAVYANPLALREPAVARLATDVFLANR